MHTETHERRRIVTPTYIRQHLQIKRNDTLKVNIRIPTTNRPIELFKNDKIDLLALIPPKTSRGESLQADADENKIRLWYKSLCSPRTVELNRYQNPETLGALLGQLQAEGAKCPTRKFAFSNKLTNEHIDFIANLRRITSLLIEAQCTYCPHKVSEAEIEEYIRAYEVATGIPVKKYSVGKTFGRQISTRINSVVLAEALLGAMDNTRKLLTTNKPDSLTKKLADGFIAKLCTGDGSFIAWKRQKRQRPDVNPRLLIADGNEKYLRDYQKILKNRGFRKIRLETQHRRVQARLSWNDVFLLYEIKAFTGTANYRKLIATIAFYLQYNRNGRRYAILLNLASKNTFTTNDIMKQGLPYDKARSYAKYMLKKGYIQVAAIGDHGQKNLSLTDKGTKLITLLMQWKQEYQNLKKTTNLNDPLTIINALKNKHSTPHPSPLFLIINILIDKQ